MLHRQSAVAIGQRRTELAKAQQEIATGRRVNSLGDDSIAVPRILAQESALRGISTNRRALAEAEQLLGAADGALGVANESAHRAYEMAVQFASETYSTADRQQARDEVRQIRARLVEVANTEIGGRNLFAGLGNASQPYSATGAFSGDTGQLVVPVGRGSTLEATLRGGEPFEDPSGGNNGLFTVLDELEAALAADDTPAITGMIDRMRGAADRISASRQQIGHRFERAENVRSALDRVEVVATVSLSLDRDADFAEAVQRLTSSETSLRAAMSVTARLSELDLTNYLR